MGGDHSAYDTKPYGGRRAHASEGDIEPSPTLLDVDPPMPVTVSAAFVAAGSTEPVVEVPALVEA